MVKAGTHTQAEAAREFGIARSSVHDALGKKEVTNKKPNTRKPPQPTIKLSDPARTAANIHAKMDANQLGRRNIQPQQADFLRGRIYNRRKKAHGGHLPKGIDQNEPFLSTAEQVAAETGVSPATVTPRARGSGAVDIGSI